MDTTSGDSVVNYIYLKEAVFEALSSDSQAALHLVAMDDFTLEMHDTVFERNARAVSI